MSQPHQSLANKHHPKRRDLWVNHDRPWSNAEWNEASENMKNHPMAQSFVNVDEVCGRITHMRKYTEYIEVAGRKMDAFVDHVNNNWTSTGKKVKGTKNSSGLTLKSKKHSETEAGIDAHVDITLIFIHGDDRREMYCKPESTVKSLLQRYAEGYGLPLRSSRFLLNGSPLFLSSLGRKTAMDLKLANLDEITISNAREISTKRTASGLIHKSEMSSKSTKKSTKNKKSRKKRNNKPTLALNDTEDKLKEAHSIELTKIFEEAEPIFKAIRQELNNLTLERKRPKTKQSLNGRNQVSTSISVVHNPDTFGLGGKAGKTSYTVNVGQVEYLYKSSKRNSNHSKSSKQRNCIDLHGCTQDQAVKNLDESLIGWADTAMKGEYPWVITVDIICGGGNQILSETVETWIKSKTNVANAPKCI